MATPRFRTPIFPFAPALPFPIHRYDGISGHETHMAMPPIRKCEIAGILLTDDLNGGGASNPQGRLHYPLGMYPKLGERLAEKALEQLFVERRRTGGDPRTCESRQQSVCCRYANCSKPS